MAVDAALANLLSPMVLAFALGLGAGLARSDLSIPDAFGKAMSIYLMFAIGLKGGVAVNENPLGTTMALSVIAGIVLSFVLPYVAFTLLRSLGGVDRVNAAAVAAHYGSISVVTFVTGVAVLEAAGIAYEGYLVAVMALMETPAIISGIWLAGAAARSPGESSQSRSELVRHVLLNGSVVLLMGAFVIGMATGRSGFDEVAPFFEAPFKGVLCLFLLDLGLIAASRLRGSRVLTKRLVVFALVMPLIGALLGVCLGTLIGLSVGGATLLGVLAASASYIAVPAAMRLALPQANPALYVTLSLAVTFPFNVLIGIPLYLSLARMLG